MLRAGELFDSPPTREWTERFLTTAGHHLLAALEGGAVIGFISGVDPTRPDKGNDAALVAYRAAGAGERRPAVVLEWRLRT